MKTVSGICAYDGAYDDYTALKLHADKTSKLLEEVICCLDYIINGNIDAGYNVMPLFEFKQRLQRHHTTANNIYARITAGTNDIDVNDCDVFEYISDSSNEIYHEIIATTTVMTTVSSGAEKN